jgi:hypothetical protein
VRFLLQVPVLQAWQEEGAQTVLTWLFQQVAPVLQKSEVVQVGVQVAHPHPEPSVQVLVVQAEVPVMPSQWKHVQQQTQR